MSCTVVCTNRASAWWPRGQARTLGDDTYVYDAQHFLVTEVHLPTFVQIVEASQEKPYLGLMLKLDQREISQLMVDSHLPPPRPNN